jgi:FAD:protein FMN transferase
MREAEAKFHLGRREFLKIAACSGLALGLGSVLTRHELERRGLKEVRHTVSLMGTILNLTLVSEDEGQAQRAIEITLAAMNRLIQIFDYRRPSSALARWNRNGILTDAPLELVQVIQRANHFSKLTQGAFDITVKPVLDAYRDGRRPSDDEIDDVDYRKIVFEDGSLRFDRPGMSATLDGLAKGRVIDEGASALQSCGFSQVIVEAGGDLAVSGSRPDGLAWQVGVQSPRPQENPGLLAVVPIETFGGIVGMATSGDYQNTFSSDFRLNHLIDPATGVSPQKLASGTVLANSVMDADALSTALMILGPEQGILMVDQLAGVEALLIDKHMYIHRSAGFPTGTYKL